MEARHLDADVIVVGGGPAGAAAAIACATRNLSVCLLERSRFAEDRPGETLHPGVEPLLEQLGVGDRLHRVVGARHPGIWVAWGGPPRFEAFGGDADGPWQGFQVERAGFDAALLARAADVGVEIRRPCRVVGVLPQDGVHRGVLTNAGPVVGRMVVDASGRGGALARRRGLRRPAHSPRLLASYGYVRGACPVRDQAPCLAGDASGWTWTALVAPHLYQWTRLSFSSATAVDWLPEELRGLAESRRSRAVDVSWRMASETAGEGWFLVGDAAACLDPASSHGVLRAIMSGMMAGHLIGAVLAGAVPETEALKAYHAWMAEGFQADVARMRHFYGDLGVRGFTGPLPGQGSPGGHESRPSPSSEKDEPCS